VGRVYRMRVDGRGRVALPREIMKELGLSFGDGVLLVAAGGPEKCLVLCAEETGSHILQRGLASLSEHPNFALNP